MPLSTATMTAAWRNRRLPAVSHRLVLASDPWPCLRTTMREPLQMAALERPNTRKMVRWHWLVLYEYVFKCKWPLIGACCVCAALLVMETFVGDLFALRGHFGVEILWHPWRWVAAFVDDCVKCYWVLGRFVCLGVCVCIRAGVSSVSIPLISRSSVRHP